nr:MAG TPA: hypothetical protein [Bacteriophage sp.]
MVRRMRRSVATLNILPAQKLELLNCVLPQLQ